jgi:hypothetical protein
MLAEPEKTKREEGDERMRRKNTHTYKSIREKEDSQDRKKERPSGHG